MTFGDNGLITQAERAKDLAESSSEEEGKGLANLAAFINGVFEGDTEEEVYDPITYTFIPQNISVTVAEYDGFMGEMNEGEFQFQIVNDGGDVLDYAYNDDIGSVPFQPITYSSEGIYIYCFTSRYE